MLYLLFVREHITTAEDRRSKWINDKGASEIFRYAEEKMEGKATMLPCYTVNDSATGTIVDVARSWWELHA